MGVKIIGDPTAIRKHIEAFTDLETFRTKFGERIGEALKQQVAQRFERNRVGGSWSPEFFVNQFKCGLAIRDLLSGAFGDTATPDGKVAATRKLAGAMRFLERLESGGDESHESDMGIDSMSGRVDWEGYAAVDMSTAEMGGIRASREAFVDDVLSSILSEPVAVWIIKKTPDTTVFAVGIGNPDYFRHLTMLPPPLNPNIPGWSETYMQSYYTWHIQEFGTATKSTSPLYPIKRAPYWWFQWKLTGARGYWGYKTFFHRGRAGRHMYLDKAGEMYEEDKSIVFAIIAEIARGLEGV